MLYHDNRREIKGTYNRSEDFTATRHIQIFGENLEEVQRWLRDTPRKWSCKHSESNSASKSWDLNVGYAGAIDLAKNGWSAGAQDLDARLQAIIPAAGRQARWGYSTNGSSASVSRFLAGNPNNMKKRSKKQFGSAPVFHIVVNTVASCMIKAEQMANYGTALVGLIDRLENSGKRVQLDVINVVKLPDDTRAVYGWNVKRASEHCDLAAVAFSIAHPAAFRRLGFAMSERLPKPTECYGYGLCADVLPIDVIDSEDALLLDGINHEPGRCNSAEDALRLAIEQLNKAAVLAGFTTIDAPLIEEDEIFGY